MRKIFYVCCIALSFVACKSTEKAVKKTDGMTDYGSPRVTQELVDDQTFLIKKRTTDKTYGYTERNPVMVGGGLGGGALNQRRFLNALAGPKGEQISYRRLGSCCHFHTKNGMIGDGGLLDKYEVVYKGLETPIILYINMYDSDVLKVPVGFTLKQ